MNSLDKAIMLSSAENRDIEDSSFSDIVKKAKEMLMNQLKSSDIRTTDFPFVRKKDLTSVIKSIENAISRIESSIEDAPDDIKPSINRSCQDLKEIANKVRLYVSKKK